MNFASSDSYKTFFDNELNLFAVVSFNSNIEKIPAIGGCRCLKYASNELAIADAIRLSQAMSLKAKTHQLPYGGAKMVVSLPDKYDRKKIMHQIGIWVESLNGSYIVASDSGTNSSDMDMIYEKTQHVACPARWPNYNPSYFTALGVYTAIQTVIPNIHKKKILVQGAGAVGMELISMLKKSGAIIYLHEIDKLKKIKAKTLYDINLVDDIYQECDLFAPCALGGILNQESLKKLKCEFVVGAANNQFSNELEDNILARDLGINVIPDVIANGGGLIHVAGLHAKKTKNEIESSIENIRKLVQEFINVVA